MSIFAILGDDEDVRLKSYTATVKGKVSTLRVEIEITDVYRLQYLLTCAEEVVQAGKARSKRKPATERAVQATPRRIGKQAALLALPKPEDPA